MSFASIHIIYNEWAMLLNKEQPTSHYYLIFVIALFSIFEQRLYVLHFWLFDAADAKKNLFL